MQQTLKWCGLSIAICAWLARVVINGFASTDPFGVLTLAPTPFNLAMSCLSILAAWMVSIPILKANKSEREPFPAQAVLLSLWLAGDVAFYYASSIKYLFFVGMFLYGTAHLMFALKYAPRKHFTLKTACILAGIMAWSAIMLTGSVSSTLLFACSFLYAQLLIMFVAFSAARAFLQSFGDWNRNTMALGAVMLLAGDLTSSIILFNKDAATLLGIERLNFDLVSMFFGASQLLIVVSAALWSPNGDNTLDTSSVVHSDSV